MEQGAWMGRKAYGIRREAHGRRRVAGSREGGGGVRRQEAGAGRSAFAALRRDERRSGGRSRRENGSSVWRCFGGIAVRRQEAGGRGQEPGDSHQRTEGRGARGILLAMNCHKMTDNSKCRTLQKRRLGGCLGGFLPVSRRVLGSVSALRLWTACSSAPCKPAKF